MFIDVSDSFNRSYHETELQNHHSYNCLNIHGHRKQQLLILHDDDMINVK